MQFRWKEWNLDHIANHGVSPAEAELVVRSAQSPFPEEIEDEKILVWGQGSGGRYLQVIYLLDPDGTAFIIHARPLNRREKRRVRRRKK
ncbi:MAG TPA: hypothetical protein VFE46_17820 [Pirellulales bacterium]|jgi:uncharacterized DUF497 family protein|nr:hypothetical protein [Pirellulales bacterium]